MNRLSKLTKLISGGLAVGMVVLGVSAASASAATPQAKQHVSGPQAKAPIEPGSKDAKASAALGSTNALAINSDGTPSSVQASNFAAGTVAGVDFQSFYNYCWKNFVYTTVNNTTSVTKYVQLRIYNQGSYRDFYTSIAPGSTIYPGFYGIDGAYSAYLYVWNGSSYQYDEYKGGTNTCNVSVTRTYNASGWVQLKIQNLGTAYATQISTELAPYPGSGTYTGTQYDYPVAGGAAVYRWFQVGTQPYGIVSRTDGSFNSPYLFSGDL